MGKGQGWSGGESLLSANAELIEVLACHDGRLFLRVAGDDILEALLENDAGQNV